ncbi:RRP8 25S rRNA [Candida maltosa Xu316]|uniref:Ribosomal RNA-processing protein 8 n=1 Tax=Candida maltosa (strain Xu316) TaxID=1245528 RepID=M3IIR7_CANMX|nr:hypothetical protein G210_3491 [Candida maltosa Xu316]
MPLFEAKGWNLSSKIKVGGLPEKKNKNKKKKEKRQSESVQSEPSPEQQPKKTTDKKRKHEEESDTKPSKKTKSESESAPAPAPLINAKKLTPLQQKMMAKLSGSRFRWINEQLYTINSEDALKLIKETPSLFDEYHQGFAQQVSSWPENPVDVFVNQIKTRAKARPVNAPGGLPGLKTKQVVVADMGCGEAQLSLDVSKFLETYNKRAKKHKQLDIKVHSFDLKKQNDRITVADIKNVPIPDESCSVVIFCLSLMGTNFLDFIKEAWRILIPRGELWIAEIKSRFSESATQKDSEKVGEEFVDSLKSFGFFHKSTDNSNKMFTRFEFFKPPADILKERQAKIARKKKKFIEDDDDRTDLEKLEGKRSEKAEGEWLLKPCIYKRR